MTGYKPNTTGFLPPLCTKTLSVVQGQGQSPSFSCVKHKCIQPKLPEGYRLQMSFSGGVFASLASARPWVQAPALQNKLKKIGAKPTVEGCVSNSSTQEAEEGKKNQMFKVSLGYIVFSSLAWTTWNPVSKAKQDGRDDGSVPGVGFWKIQVRCSSMFNGSKLPITQLQGNECPLLASVWRHLYIYSAYMYT